MMEKTAESDVGKDEEESEEVPLGKLRRCLSALSCGSDNNKPLVALISTGSYCPPHKMHLQIFEAAKEWLESKHNYKVVAGWISPSHDEYVEGKMWSAGTVHIPSFHRLAMCRLLVRDSNWVSVSSWEALRGRFVDFPSVAEHHANFLAERFPDHKIQLIYLAGADLAYRCRLYSGLKRGAIPVVAVGRPGHTKEIASGLDISKLPPVQNPSGVCERFILVPTEMENFSSTKVRKQLALGKSVTKLCGTEIEEYIRREQIDKLFR
jgi:nicotinate (nicotinamide) nucleotide adenylyltransferase